MVAKSTRQPHSRRLRRLPDCSGEADGNGTWVLPDRNYNFRVARLSGQSSCPRGVNLSGMWRVQRLDQINAYIPANLFDFRSLTLEVAVQKDWPVYNSHSSPRIAAASDEGFPR